MTQSTLLSRPLRAHVCRALPALLLALAACGTTTRFAPLNSSPHPLRARPPETVQIFTTGVPAQPYTEIGLIQGTQSSEYSLHDMPEIIASMRQEAGRIGCDALILNGPNSKSTSSVNGALLGDHHERTLEGYWGTCIAFLPPPPPELASAPLVAPAPAPLVVPAPTPAPAAAPLVVPAPSAAAASAPRVAPAPAPAPVVAPAPPPAQPAPAPLAAPAPAPAR